MKAKYDLIYGQEFDKISTVFESLSGYEINLKIQSLKNLEETYVDPFDINNEGIHFILPELLSDRHLFLIGRSGSGKTTYFLRAYWDCLKTIIEKKYYVHEASDKIVGKRIFPIFINLFKYEGISEIQEHGTNSISNLNIIRLIYNIVQQIKQTLNEKFYEKSYVEILKKTSKKVNDKLEDIIRDIKEGNQLVKKIYDQEEIQHQGKKSKSIEVSAEILPVGIKPSLKIKGGKENYITIKTNYLEKTITNVHKIFQILSEVLKELNIYYCVLFIDQFSEIKKATQHTLMEKVFPFFIRDDVRTSANIKFACKFSVYPSRIELGPFRLDSEFSSSIWLDKNEYIKSVSVNTRFKEKIELMQYSQVKFLETLIKKRFKMAQISEEIEFNDLFVYNRKYSDIHSLLLFLYNSTMNIPRYLGLILKLAFIRSRVNKKGISFDLLEEIVKKELYESQRSILTQTIFNEWYERQWVIKIYKNILEKLYLIKYTNKKQTTAKRYSAYFLMDKFKRPYLKILEDAFLIHHISEVSVREASQGSTRSSKLDFYMINMKHVIENNYPTDIVKLYQKNILNQSKFDFSDLIVPVEVYICPNCHKIEEKDVFIKDGNSYCLNCLYSNSERIVVEYVENIKYETDQKETASEYGKSIKKEFEIEYEFQNFMKRLYDLNLITQEDALETQIISILYKTDAPLIAKEIALKLAISIDPRTLAAVTRRFLFDSERIIDLVSRNPNNYQLNQNLLNRLLD